MQLWGGKVDGQSLGPATFSSVDQNGSLTTVYDVNRPEPDGDWDGSYICINPGGTGNATLPTIWRRISDAGGFINSTGSMTLMAPIPSAAYAQIDMTYELFKMFTPDQWISAVNFALRASYPQRHRLVAFENPENPDTIFYDWGRLASELAIADPTIAPTATAINDPGGKVNYWATGVYKVGYSVYNSGGETLVSPTTTLSLSPTKIVEFPAITIPDNAVGIYYWCTADPGGSTLSQFTTGSGLLPDPTTDNINPVAGVADRTTFIVPKIRFFGPPRPLSRTVPAFNTSGLDLSGLSLKSLKRRTNPGQSPQRYVDLNPNWWREIGGNQIQVYFEQNDQFHLRFECMAPVRALTGESDSTEEPLELMIAGSMMYLWNSAAMTSSSQNVQVWTAEAKAADVRFTKARNLYQIPGPRKTMRRPFIHISRWREGWW
jgi:hypothetical protein